MKKHTALKHFGTNTAIAAILGITPQAVSKWGEQIPLLSAMKLERVTKRKLKVNLSAYEHVHHSSK